MYRDLDYLTSIKTGSVGVAQAAQLILHFQRIIADAGSEACLLDTRTFFVLLFSQLTLRSSLFLS